MKKKFKIIEAKATEVSLCSKNNSGANKQTSFEIIKSDDNQKVNKAEVLEILKYAEECARPIIDKAENVNKEFVNYIRQELEYRVNNTLYCLLTDALIEQLYTIKNDETKTKEQKAVLYSDLFFEFVSQYMNSPITKTSDDKYSISINKSLSKDIVNPQTVEKIGEEMEQEKTNVLNNVIETLKSLVSPTKKTETEQEVAENSAIEKTEENAEESAETIETEQTETVETEEAGQEPKEEVEQNENEEATESEKVEEPAEKVEEATEPVEVKEVEEATKEAEDEAVEEPQEQKEEIEKASNVMTELQKAQARIEELEKAQRESLEAIEKSKFVTKAREEFSMLVGTPEEIGEKLFAISKSNLSADVQEYILNNFKQVSKANSELLVEKGSNTQDAESSTEEAQERELYKRAEAIAKEKGISIKKALREI